MSRKDFNLIASVIANFSGESAGQALAIAMANALRKTNPRFDTDRFLKACGVEDYDASWMSSQPRKVA